MEGRKLAYYEMVDLEQADQSIKACLLDAGRNVIAVGYYLKVIRDRELFRDAGYETIWDYARETYGFSKDVYKRQCQAHLDPGERCDCELEKERERVSKKSVKMIYPGSIKSRAKGRRTYAL